jgi:hypothetical protein
MGDSAEPEISEDVGGEELMPAMTPEEIAAEAGPGANLGGRRGRHGHPRAVGSRVQVMNGNAHHTPGGLTKAHLKYNKYGRIVSAKKSALAKKKGTLKKWEQKTGVKWTIKKGKPVKVKHGRK